MRFIVFGAVVLLGGLAHSFPAYHDVQDLQGAEKEARARNLPLAWLGGTPDDSQLGNSDYNSWDDLQKMALATLHDNAVILYFDGHKIDQIPMFVHMQFHIHDDGVLPDNADWDIPKVVFTNPEATQILGRVSATQMKADREAALASALQIIRNNPAALALPAPPAPATEAAATTNPPTDDGAAGGLAWGIGMIQFFNAYGLYFLCASVVVIGLIFWVVYSRRERE